MFAASSVVTPFCLGMIVGAVASGRVPAVPGLLWLFVLVNRKEWAQPEP